jgi:hypothetical protein
MAPSAPVINTRTPRRYFKAAQQFSPKVGRD